MYNNALSSHAVSAGDSWFSAHSTLVCNDFLLTQVPFVDYIYTDPPWNDAIMRKFWSYRNEPPRYDFKQFMHLFITKLAYLCPNGLIFTEMGLPGSAILKKEIQEIGGQIFYTSQLSYGKNTKFNLFGWSMIFQNCNMRLEIYQDEIISQFDKNATLLDPCAGECYFLEMGLKRGLHIWGTEIIPDKLASGIRRLSKWEQFTKAPQSIPS